MQDHSPNNALSGILRRVFDLRVFLALVTIAYAFGFSRYAAAPGNNPAYPLGWWGWFDQGQYLISSQAFAALDFSAAKHFCPPLYSMLGAIFVNFTDPFWLIDLICLLWFATVFVLIARRYVPNWAAVLIFIVMVIINRRIFENFLIPWTSTLSTALLATGLYAYLRIHERTKNAATASRQTQTPPGMTGVFAVSLALGLLFPLRPLDGIAGGLTWVAWLAASVRLLMHSGHGDRIVRHLAAAFSGFLIGPLFYITFNWTVFGTPLMNDYIEDSMLNGYFPADIGEKFVSIFLNGYALYLEPRSGILEHYPFLLLAFPAIVYIAIYGDSLLRLICLLVCLQFALYLPYGDLLPTGLWRYMNIHYFKWTFPFLALFAWYGIESMARQWRTSPKTTIAWSTLFGIAGLLLLSLDFRITLQPVTIATAPNNAESGLTQQSITLQNPGTRMDFIDLTGINGDFTEVYFGEHALWLDGQKLRRVRDYRVLPAPQGIRILFIRPTSAHSVSFLPDEHLARSQGPLQANIGKYKIVLGTPRFSSHKN